jgi:hypothetical protein
MEGHGLSNCSAALRPTRNRLLIAMGVSTCSVVLLLALLGSLVDFAAGVSKPRIKFYDVLTIHIRKGERERNAYVTTGDGAARSLPQEQTISSESADLPQEVASADAPEAPAHLPPAKDWLAMAGEAAKTSVDYYFRQEESRASMWQQTRSIMFQPASDTILKDIEPLLADIRFKRRSRVIGLGINVGSCFIGIPIAGVPVEERSIGISFFICGQDSG